LYLLVDLQEAAKSNLAAALSTTVEELADHEARASTGDQPQSAVTDVQRARQLVVSAQVHTLSTSPSKRRKRTASGNLGTLTCTIGREYATFGFKSR